MAMNTSSAIWSALEVFCVAPVGQQITSLAHWAFFLFGAVAGFLRHSLIVFSLNVDAFAIGVLGPTIRILTSRPNLPSGSQSFDRPHDAPTMCRGCQVTALASRSSTTKRRHQLPMGNAGE